MDIPHTLITAENLAAIWTWNDPDFDDPVLTDNQQVLWDWYEEQSWYFPEFHELHDNGYGLTQYDRGGLTQYDRGVFPVLTESSDPDDVPHCVATALCRAYGIDAPIEWHSFEDERGRAEWEEVEDEHHPRIFREVLGLVLLKYVLARIGGR